MRLAKSFSADLGKGVKVGRVSGETGLATLRFPDGINWITLPPAIRLVRLLQHIEAMDKQNLGISPRWQPKLTPEMDSWLRRAPETQAKPARLVRCVHCGATVRVDQLERHISETHTPSRQRRWNTHVHVHQREGFKQCCFCGKPAVAGSNFCSKCVKSEPWRG